MITLRKFALENKKIRKIIVERNHSTSGAYPEIKEKTIDIEDVFRKKNPKLYRRTPRFILRWMERLVKLDEINRIINIYADDDPIAFSKHILEYFKVDMEVVGEQNIEQSGRLIVASNHPLGGLDGVALLSIIGEQYPDVVFPVNDILLFIPQFRATFIPINKHGSNVSNLKDIHNYFSSENPVLYFPEGLCSRKRRGKISDWNWRKTFIMMAVKHQRYIVPTHFEGKNSRFFYNLSNFRKKLGIKANIEMILLPREMFHQKGKFLKAVFAKPVPCTFFDERYKPTEWAELMRKFVYTIKTGEESFETFVNKITG
ncbi:MAG: 1-acyl-sn-glycerol-3-phosphate acyltransferase [Bacteroidales bacterium]|jgi:1-acyl-sn-glycerol-3-phosphate acyltransferase|nr:1-acyl-sn-glycerol-3-phosphate acyltransferase [Bacteroidales bacterium]